MINSLNCLYDTCYTYSILSHPSEIYRRWPFQGGTPILPFINVCFLFLLVFCVFVTFYIHVVSMSWFCAVRWLSAVYVMFPACTHSSHTVLNLSKLKQEYLYRHLKNGMIERIIVFNFLLTQSESSKFKSMLQASLENIFSMDSRSTCVFIILVCNEAVYMVNLPFNLLLKFLSAILSCCLRHSPEKRNLNISLFCFMEFDYMRSSLNLMCLNYTFTGQSIWANLVDLGPPVEINNCLQSHIFFIW